LAAFYLAHDDAATRAAVEAHLLICRACLAGYFEMKRAFDAGAALDSSAPPATVRRSLRAAFRQKFGPLAPRSAPARLALVGLAAAAAIAAILYAFPHPSFTPSRSAALEESGQPFDSASQVAQSLNTL
jgi:hypothetical protein